MKKNDLKAIKRILDIAEILENKRIHRIVLVYKDNKQPLIKDITNNKLLKEILYFMKKKRKCCIFVDGKLIALGENFLIAEALLKKADLIDKDQIQFTLK